MPAMLRKLVVVGVGLIGGSFALALKAAGAVDHVVGVGRRETTLERARALGIIDAIGALEASTLSDADLVLVSVPVAQTEKVLAALAPHLRATTLVTDAGSTKHDVVAAARAALGTGIRQFVPGHPIAGTEHSGPEAAFAELFRGRNVVLTPLEENSAQDVARVRRAWENCGARVREIGVTEHDRILAAVSHLPHLLAYALVDHVTGRPGGERFISFAAGGFRDFTRIASSHSEMWRDICMANRIGLIEELDGYTVILQELRAILERGDALALQAVFERAREARNHWLEQSGT
ncbi:MAG: prephenate dehydrogenase [Betaproteobacteria bacterium RIFCSPLOWO2_12_FULL_63_13]|nr:MAG: prephenate dehydrogenase [Betaproteobacteria bacterium RIFCSPLOWO2_02_FULL_63_19]OGA48564.1 MAG: prephenate dehydrogenase [Betaproteobacteria bacterium RIFCSPLOWO2_12_FULL_63_13]